MLIAFRGLAVAGTATLAATITIASSPVFVLYATLVVPTIWTAIDRSLRIAEAKRVFGAIGAGGPRLHDLVPGPAERTPYVIDAFDQAMAELDG